MLPLKKLSFDRFPTIRNVVHRVPETEHTIDILQKRKKEKKIGRVETNSNNEKQNKTKCKIIIIITIKRRGKKI